MMRVDPDSTPRYCLILDDPVAGYGSAPRLIFRRRVNFFCAVRTRSSNTKWFGAMAHCWARCSSTRVPQACAVYSSSLNWKIWVRSGVGTAYIVKGSLQSLGVWNFADQTFAQLARWPKINPHAYGKRRNFACG